MTVHVSAKGCPVCGYPEFDALDEFGCTTFQICPSCGVESGYGYGADVDSEHLQKLRRQWFVEERGHWWSTARPAPDGWDAQTQLERAGFRDL